MVKTFVLNGDGKPLVPCHPARARELTRKGKANWIRHNTIKLTYIIQDPVVPETVVALDPGTHYTGLVVYLDFGHRREVVFMCVIKMRDFEVADLLLERRRFRNARRNRKVRHREKRFNHRVHKDKLQPSIRQLHDSLVKIVKKIFEFLPVSKIHLETVKFDFQRQVNPNISGKEYQNGPLREDRMLEVLFKRYGKRCVYCKATSPKRWEVDHIIPKSKGGVDSLWNRVPSCERCNRKKGNKTAFEFGYPSIQKRGLSFRAAAWVNTIRWELYNSLSKLAPVVLCHGGQTRRWREQLGFPKEVDDLKSHIYDALAIASRGTTIQPINQLYYWRIIRRQNRKLYKGDRSHIRNQSKYVLFGFRQWDKVRLPDGTVGFIKGKRSSGYFAISDITGKSVNNSISYKNLQLLSYRSTLLMERSRFSSPPTVRGSRSPIGRRPKRNFQ